MEARCGIFIIYDLLNNEYEMLQKRAARFVITSNYTFEEGGMTGILAELKWETLQRRRKNSRLI